MTPTAGNRYDKDKVKVQQRGYSNPRSSRDSKPDRRPINFPVSKPLEMYEKKPTASKRPQRQSD